MSAAPPPPQGEEGFARNRAVVSDDGHRIRISVYVAGVEAPLGVAELPLEVAARLSADLAGAVAAHLTRERNHRVGVVRGPAQ
jgi:hypothetical protein